MNVNRAPLDQQAIDGSVKPAVVNDVVDMTVEVVVNNVVYYSWFDTAVNGLLIECGALDIHAGPVIGLVVETRCNYFAPLAFPQAVVAGIRVRDIGTSSVRYEIGLFAADEHDICAAKGHFIHVYVDRTTRQPVALPPQLLSVLETLK